uniref:Phosphodiesterase n=1 Tax=Chromera velia CCMP2878 TaxID=1169474 RepID=A0A0G4G7D7_9ALVE|eukprot:Cvel_20521.t1-p1 / transcript=Cvel_20521.t1 / gene=Cvel_20521 / organism=Chromera_velia_CCMP2878 / gene_product=cAMP-specific 3',5'-cyclic phosphodiesterase 4A, putative / transcript_product=cAMP-specific 3',5'-cyclic phosphodiesterase 4A, putative / location=Cvel_scaffold1848:11241-18910(-) / protein_length=814 / sequence_SO=supercontig / SO=protein_coding / is_pseudo=false
MSFADPICLLISLGILAHGANPLSELQTLLLSLSGMGSMLFCQVVSLQRSVGMGATIPPTLQVVYPYMLFVVLALSLLLLSRAKESGKEEQDASAGKRDGGAKETTEKKSAVPVPCDIRQQSADDSSQGLGAHRNELPLVMTEAEEFLQSLERLAEERKDDPELSAVLAKGHRAFAGGPRRLYKLFLDSAQEGEHTQSHLQAADMLASLGAVSSGRPEIRVFLPEAAEVEEKKDRESPGPSPLNLTHGPVMSLSTGTTAEDKRSGELLPVTSTSTFTGGSTPPMTSPPLRARTVRGRRVSVNIDGGPPASPSLGPEIAVTTSGCPCLGRLDTDVFEIAEETGGHPLSWVAWAAFDQYESMFAPLGMQRGDLMGFASLLKENYKSDIPFHTDTHGTEVANSMSFLLQVSGAARHAEPVDFAGSLIAAMAHDVGHPGVTNRYLVATTSPLAIQYNDESVLENFHSALCFQLLMRSHTKHSAMYKNNSSASPSSLSPLSPISAPPQIAAAAETSSLSSPLLSPNREDSLTRPIHERMRGETWSKFRSLVISLILETDMMKHFQSLGSFNTTMGINQAGSLRRLAVTLKETSDENLRGKWGDQAKHWGDSDAEAQEKRMTVLKAFMKISDLSHAGKPFELHKKWSLRLYSELHAQGDMEGRLGLPVTPLCDRSRSNIPKDQINFLSFIALPMFAAVGNALRSAQYDTELLSVGFANLDHWVELCGAEISPNTRSKVREAKKHDIEHHVRSRLGGESYTGFSLNEEEDLDEKEILFPQQDPLLSHSTGASPAMPPRRKSTKRSESHDLRAAGVRGRGRV